MRELKIHDQLIYYDEKLKPRKLLDLGDSFGVSLNKNEMKKYDSDKFNVFYLNEYIILVPKEGNEEELDFEF